VSAAGRGLRAQPAAQALIVAADVVTAITIDRPRSPASRPTSRRSPRPLAVGVRLGFVARFLGRRLDYTYEVRDLVPGERLVMNIDHGLFPMETTSAWEDAPGAATRMTLRNRREPAASHGSRRRPWPARCGAPTERTCAG
jgi:hypothetical protein